MPAITADTTTNGIINGASSVAGGAAARGTPLGISDTIVYVPVGDVTAKFSNATPFRIQIGNEVCNVTAVDSVNDKLTIVRGPNLASPDTNTAAVWAYGTTIQQVVTAGTLNDIWTNIVNSGYAIYNVRAYGALLDGSHDDTTAWTNAINAAVNAGGYCTIYVPGTSTGSYVTSPLPALSAPGIVIRGDGPFASWLRPKNTFSGAQILSITANGCEVRDLSIAYSSTLGAGSGGNPAANAITVTGARDVRLRDLEIRGINGWALVSTGTAGQANLDFHCDRVHILHCASGVHTIGDTGSNFAGQQYYTDLNVEIAETGDAFLAEDINDIWLTQYGAAAAQGTATNQALHLKGACSAIHVNGVDIGVTGTANAAVCLIESGANGSPTNVHFNGGVMQGGTVPLSITSGSASFDGVTFKKSNGDGTAISGATGPIWFNDCRWQTNGVGGGTCYDIDLTTNAAFNVYIRNSTLESPKGSGANLVTNPVNDTNHKGIFEGVAFIGTGVTASTVFASAPQIVRNSPGYNPRGNITAPTIGASPFTSSSSQNDVTIYFTALNSITAFKIGGTSLGVPVANVGYYVRARQTLEVDYSAAAPTWLWIAD